MTMTCGGTRSAPWHPTIATAWQKSCSARYPTLSPEEQLDVVHTLASRPSYGWELTQALKRGDVPKRDVPAYVARLLQRSRGKWFS